MPDGWQRRAVLRNETRPCEECGKIIQVQAHTGRKCCDPCAAIRETVKHARKSQRRAQRRKELRDGKK